MVKAHFQCQKDSVLQMDSSSNTVTKLPVINIEPFINFWLIYITDFMILLIALHTVMTVFKPQSVSDDSGLYPYRYTAYASFVAFPTIMACLPFIHGKSAYTPTTTTCAQPIRPFWYRLALGWVPRYLILIFILGVYAAVYLYVRYKFKDVAACLSERSSSYDSDPLTDVDTAETINGYEGSSSDPNVRSPNTSLLVRHRTIKKQLRYMFIYPLVYLLMWMFPFINHCYGYTNIQAPFELNSLTVASVTLQCAADCIVFNFREKPWKHMKAMTIFPFRRQLPLFRNKGHAQSNNQLPPLYEDNWRGNGPRKSRHWWDLESTNISNDGIANGEQVSKANV